MNEGLACAVSELLNPGLAPHLYAYQSEDSLLHVLEHAPGLDREIHAELRKGAQGTYRSLYDPARYAADMPRFAHYVWAWRWARTVLAQHCGGDVARLTRLCSKDLVENALAFQLARDGDG